MTFDLEYQEKIREWAEAYDKVAIVLTQEEFDEIYDDVYFDGLLASESVLARDWNTPEEDAAWEHL